MKPKRKPRRNKGLKPKRDGECRTCGAVFGEPHSVDCMRELNVKTPKQRQKFRPKWPIYSGSMAVGAHEVELAKKIDRERGAPPTEYRVNKYSAEPILTSPQHQRDFAAAHGCINRNSFLG